MSKNASHLTIDSDSGESGHFICPSRSCDSARWDYAWSYKHAKQMGWIFTEDIIFCDPEKKDKGVMVCAECWAKALANAGIKV